MKKIIISLFALCCIAGSVWSQECPPSATATTTISFTRNNPTILSGAFSVSSTKQVNFSKGNLQYNPAFNSWRFAEHQYDMIGASAANTTAAASRSSVDGWMDLFGWGTSGYDNTYNDPTAVNFQPWAYTSASSDNVNNPYHYGPSIEILPAGSNWSDVNDANNYDWGVYNFTEGAEAGLRTLTKDEWVYLFNTRSSTTQAKTWSGFATLFGVEGIILLPDGWTWTGAVKTAADNASFDWVGRNESVKKAYTNNVIAYDALGIALWEAMEDAGAIFLPCAGYRGGSGVSLGYLIYWTSTPSSASSAYRVRFFCRGGYDDTDVNPSDAISRERGNAVRLVKDKP